MPTTCSHPYWFLLQHKTGVTRDCSGEQRKQDVGNPHLLLDPTRLSSHSPVRVELTTLDTFGEAPRCSRVLTMCRCPMKAATCRGVRPDCGDKGVRSQDRG